MILNRFLLLAAFVALGCCLSATSFASAQPLIGLVQEEAEEAKPAAEEADSEKKPDDEKKPDAEKKADDPDEPSAAEKAAAEAALEKAAAEERERKRNSKVVRARMMDGSLLAGELSIDEIVVETEFGILKVPVTSILSVTPGLDSHPELQERIKQLIEDLGSSVFADRETAQKELLSIGQAARLALEERAKDKDAERKKRVNTLLEQFEELRTDEELDDAQELINQDTIETTSFTIVGDIKTDTFAIESKYGTLEARLSHIQNLERDVGEKTDVRTTFFVEGTHLVQRSFKASKIRLEPGARVTISATGTIIMTPWGNIPCSPDGNSSQFGWYLQNQIPAGALCARIGRNGKEFKVGSSHTFTAKTPGVLYFAIAMNSGQVNNNFPGKYQLKIRVQRK